MVAKCRTCNAVFAFDDQLGGSPPPRAMQAPVALPDGWTLLEDDAAPFGGAGYRKASGPTAKSLTIRWRWFKATHLFLLFFAVIWCGFLVFWYTGATAAGAPWIFFVFPLVHVAVGVGVFYSAVAGLLNSTTLIVGDGQLSIAHRPLPWLGARTLAANEIKQLYCVEKIKRTKNGHATTYVVKAQRRGGDEVDLVKNLDEPAQALFIEQKVEDALGIQDVPVRGELRK
jgi:hypothetical protein